MTYTARTKELSGTVTCYPGPASYSLTLHPGEIWAATAAGVTRLDTDTLQKITVPPLPKWYPTAVNFAPVAYLTTSPTGNIWVGYGNKLGGVSFYDDEAGQWRDLDETLPSRNRVSGIAFEPDDRIWVSTIGAGLAEYDGTRWHMYKRHASDTAEKEAPPPIINDLTIDAQNRLWLAASDGLYRYGGKEFEKIGSWRVPASAVAVDEGGAVWVGTEDGTLRCYNEGQWRRIHPWEKDGVISNIAVDRTHNIWVATRGQGLWCYDGDLWEAYSIASGKLPASTRDDVLDVEIDASNDVWLATWGGLCHIQKP